MPMDDARGVMDLCDALRDSPPTQRAVALLALLGGERAAAELDLGAVQGLLLDLCERRIGPVLPARTRCPACGAASDLDIEIASLRQPAGAGAEAVLRAHSPEGEVAFRLPRASDLLALQPEADSAAARRVLLMRCVVSPQAAALTEAALDAVAAAMEQAAPQADVSLALDCAACGAAHEAMLDAGVFLWHAVSREADALADEVHALASAYHWHESDILAMSPARRRGYLDRIGA